MTAIAAIVVTHASAAVLPALLASLREHEPAVVVVVVDSGSPDGPPAGLDVPVVSLENVGFGAACNAGVASLGDQRATPEFIVLLNPDVRLAGPSLTETVALMGKRADVGVATGPVIDLEGNRQPSAWGPTSPTRALWFASGLQLQGVRALVGHLAGRGNATGSASTVREDLDVDGHVLGGAMIVRRECWEAIGGFDEDFFLYWEDADLCQRARDAGWEVRVLPCTPMVHEAGTSSAGVTGDQRWGWYLDGADLFASKHLSDRQRRRLMAALRWGRRFRRRRP